MSATFNWNVFPSTRLDEAKLVTPLGCLFTPFPENPPKPCHGVPLKCQCLAITGPHTKLDRKNGMWWCGFCQKKTFGAIDELLAAYTADSVVYDCVDIGTQPVDQIQVLVIDTWQHRDHQHWNDLKEALTHAAGDDKYLLITFSDTVHVHRPQGEMVGFDQAELTLAGLFNDQGLARVHQRLNLPRSNSDLLAYLFLAADLTDRLDALSAKMCTTFLPSRCVGYALYIAAVMIAAGVYTAQVHAFVAGPGTQFPGLITEANTRPRLHHDIEQLQAPHYLPAYKYYLILALAAAGHTLQDAFVIGDSLLKKPTSINPLGPQWSLQLYTGLVEQVGVHEMRPLVSGLGGLVYAFELFALSRFRAQLSLRPAHYTNAELTVVTLTDLKVGRMVFGGVPLPLLYSRAQATADTHPEKISDTVTRYDALVGKKLYTNRWQFPRLTGDDTLAVFFEMNTVRLLDRLAVLGTEQVHIQFQLKYWDHNSRCWRLQVTTVNKPTTLLVLAKNKRKYTDGLTRIVTKDNMMLKDLALLQSFDQTAWVVLLARLLVNKIDYTLGFEPLDLVAAIADDALVELFHHFGAISELGVVGQLVYHDLNRRYHINPRFARLPSIIYNLRKNPQLFRIFNSSPDETAVYHHWFLRFLEQELVMAIEPKLEVVGRGPVPLDPQCLDMPLGTWMVLDNQFTVIIYKVVKTADDDEHLHPSNNEDRIFARDLPPPVVEYLDKPRRFIPKYVLTQTDHSQQRFLHLRLNPANRDIEVERVEKLFLGLFSRKVVKPVASYDLLMTDDISLDQFYDGVTAKVKKFSP